MPEPPYLERVHVTDRISVWRVIDSYGHRVQKYVVSTRETRDILNTPEIVGHTFRRKMREALVLALTHYPDPRLLETLDDTRSGVLCFLRGGLNFDLANALGDAFGFEKQSVSYMTSQRDKDKNGRWFIKDAQYQKFVFERNSVIFCGDIVATGSTVANGVETLLQNAKNSGRPIRRLVFFTIGCHKLEKILETFFDPFRAAFKGFEGIDVIYLEGKFHLADSKTDVEIKVQGTDLMRRDALMAPEFLLSQYDRLPPCLEQCVIYDGGTRSFNTMKYLAEVVGYWMKVRNLAMNGKTLLEYLEERFPDAWMAAPGYAADALRSLYRGIDESLVQAILHARARRFEGDFALRAAESEPLLELALRRIDELELRPIKRPL